MFAHRFCCTFFLGLVLILGAAAAHAGEYCVGTVGELNNALMVASQPTGQSFVVKLKQGTYHIGGSWLASSHSYNALQLLGGYNSDCSARTLNPTNTTIDGDGGDFGGFNLFDDLRIEGLRFQNMTGYAHSVYLFVDGDSEHVLVEIRNCEFRGVGVTATFYNATTGAASIINNLIVGAPEDGVNLQLDWQDSISAGIGGNTIVNSAGRGINAESSGYLNIFNNIVWNNATRDIWIEGDSSHNPGGALYRQNLYGTRLGAELSGSYGTLHDDPLFVNASNFRLQGTSPAVNSGTTNTPLPAVDLDNHPRVIGSTVDRGAYESTVDDTVSQTLTVTNTNNFGSGSLRQAIMDANANPDFSFINFDIPGSCPRTIAPASDLPSITQGVRIDAYSQPGSAANTLTTGDNATRCIVLNGRGLRGIGLNFTGTSSTQFWLQGIVIEGFTGVGLRLFGGTDALIWGNQFGGKLGATTLTANDTNIVMTGFSSSAAIGGNNVVQRNVIAGAIHNGIEVTGQGLFSSTGNSIIGNLIGTYGPETALSGNDNGVWLATSGNTVSGNVIVASVVDGVHLEGTSAHNNTIDHNRIGRTDTVCLIFPAPTCLPDDAPNQRHGVSFIGGAHDNLLQTNTIWNNGVMGVSVGGSGKGNELYANSIYTNTGYGIDLDGSGSNDNDTAPAAQNLPNRGLNFPIITRAYGGIHSGWIEGTLDSINGPYQIQVFSSAQPDSTFNGEGEVYHRTSFATISDASSNQNGSANFRIAFSSPSVNLAGRSFALTAIDAAGNTSEFSYSSPYLCDVIFRDGLASAIADKCP